MVPLFSIIVSILVGMVKESGKNCSKKSDKQAQHHRSPTMKINKDIMTVTTGSYNKVSVVSAKTACPAIIMSYTKKPGRSASGFIKPMKVKFEEDPQHQRPLMKIDCWCPRRGLTHPELNEAMLAVPNKNFFWWSFGYITSNPDEDVTATGMHQASVFTTIANESEQFRGTDNVFQFVKDETTSPPHPVNHYVRNRDTVLLLKTVYSTEEKHDLEADRIVMEQFFGTEEEGTRILSNYTEDEFRDLE